MRICSLAACRLTYLQGNDRRQGVFFRFSQIFKEVNVRYAGSCEGL